MAEQKVLTTSQNLLNDKVCITQKQETDRDY